MKRLSIFLVVSCLTLGCASLTVRDDAVDSRVFGKATAEATCVTEVATGTSTCTTKVEGHGLTENAVGVITEFFKTLVAIPGAVVRTAGAGLP